MGSYSKDCNTWHLAVWIRVSLLLETCELRHAARATSARSVRHPDHHAEGCTRVSAELRPTTGLFLTLSPPWLLEHCKSASVSCLVGTLLARRTTG